MNVNNDGEEAPIEARVFKMPSQRRKENWLCVKLIAKEDILKNKKYSSSDAIGAYCSVCESRIPYSHSNPSNLSRHMISKHKDVLSKYQDEQKQKKRSIDEASINRFFSTKKGKAVKEASYADRKVFQMLIAFWTCTSLRPFAI